MNATALRALLGIGDEVQELELAVLEDGSRLLVPVDKMAELFQAVAVPSYSNMFALDDQKGYGFGPYLRDLLGVGKG